ncbi:MAG: RhuM family protein [Arcobacter sp.]|jgi:prophage antirepressor-like protein|uniref:RhuM family protein n=1 Tax=Arcobacter sp. TaxID=1872629 RepID=UPI002582E7E4|nr:RhuM family protein [Arcobacter sp.]MDD3007920.1 RhuM family protein [Arcobacter sp.]MDY3204633.1 RhuM family protein [Arcobacter sp.]
MQENKSNIVIYNDGELELKISLNNETIWLTQAQLSNIFEKDQSVISRHINNIFKDNEVDEKSNMQKMHIANSDKPIRLYSLDIILAVGYRTNSSKAIKFRQWATSVLKNYIQNGYVINSEKITNDRFVSLENELILLKSKVENISNLFEDKTLKPKQGIFYNGQIFDAYVFINDLLKSAVDEVLLIDKYIDETVFTIFSKYPNIKVKIYTQNITKQLKLDFQKYQTQYQNIELVEFRNSHDRFLILDKKEVYHLGASIKDLGKKWFAFSKFDIKSFDILKRLN